MEIKYAYEMTRKAEEVRKEIQAKNNALARALTKFLECVKIGRPFAHATAGISIISQGQQFVKQKVAKICTNYFSQFCAIRQ